ncbi:hypothetical protein ABTN16_19360, partial [Acinetobacter baumannii]
LARLAPVHFRVDTATWQAAQERRDLVTGPVNCAPLVPIRTMRGASQCHMCGRCAGFRDAVALSARSPNHEIVQVGGEQTNPWDSVLIL